MKHKVALFAALLLAVRAEQTGVADNRTRLRQKMPDVVTLPQLCKEPTP